ncbi:MAG TPA: Rap1a/Tai family immunity protein [Rhizomicrobium sp.]|nr:Rap1a/Tai family immunity protein [Rhizomicrobium sp.]
MKNCIILSVMLLSLWALYVAFHTPPAVANGADLRRNCGASNVWNDVACQSYVGGVVEGIAVASHSEICLPERFDIARALPIVRRYMAHHPDVVNAWSPQIVQQALGAAYPCRLQSNSLTARSD